MKKYTVIFLLVSAVILSVVLTGMAPRTVMPELNSAGAYLVEYDTGTVLYSANENDRRPVASMVKIMSLLLTFESVERGEHKLDEIVTISHEAAMQTGSELFVDENAQYTLSDLIKGTVVVSGNDSCVALAETVGGSAAQFVENMNTRAKELGMENTLFANATGLPSEREQYSTAKDVTIMTRALLKHPEYFQYSKIWLEDYKHPSGRITQLANTNKMIRFYQGCDSGKTGYTDAAKYCLSASSVRNGMRVIGTTMGATGSKERFADMTKLFNYAFANYKTKAVLKAGDAIDQNIAVQKGKIEEISPIAKTNLTALMGINAKEVTVEYELPDKVKAPMRAGSVVGKAKLVCDGAVIAETDLLLPVDLDKATFWDYVKKICK